MDKQGAKEYHSVLWQRLKERRRSTFDLLSWIGALSLAGFFAFGSYSGAAFGALIGWGIAAILASIDRLLIDITHLEMLRHLHEHTDEAQDGKRIADVQESVGKVARKWW